MRTGERSAENLTDRLNTLEHVNRRLRYAVLCFMLLMLATTVAARMIRSRVLVAPAFEVVDQNGDTRARLDGRGLTFPPSQVQSKTLRAQRLNLSGQLNQLTQRVATGCGA